MQSIDDNRLILALAIQRIPGLHPDERLVLWDLVDDELTLSLLLSSDVEAAIGRSRGGRPWSPDSYLEAALRDARFLARSGCRYIHFDDEAYPALLRETARPPFGLFARGGGFDPSTIAVSIVGTRMPTGRGLDASFAIARDLSAAGLSIVSGLARGIDHRHGSIHAYHLAPAGGEEAAEIPAAAAGIEPASANRDTGHDLRFEKPRTPQKATLAVSGVPSIRDAVVVAHRSLARVWSTSLYPLFRHARQPQTALVAPAATFARSSSCILSFSAGVG